MAVPVQMPNVGITVESCIITKWFKQPGEPVKQGEPLFEYETDKTTLEEESPADGIMLAQFFNEYDEVPVMTNICVIGAAGESADAYAPAGAASAAPEQSEAPAQEDLEHTAKTPQTVSAPAAAAAPAQTTAASNDFIGVSPRARALAEKMGLDPYAATPTGPEGRIIEHDIRTLAENGPAAVPAAATAAPALAPAAEPEYVDERMSNVRRTIARQMTLSLTSMAQLTHNTSFDATEIRTYRRKLKKSGEDLGMNNISLNDMIMFAVSRLLMQEEHRALNAHMIADDTIRYFNGVHLGMAVDTDRGLLVPTIRNADKLSLNELAAKAKELAKICRDGKATPDMLAGASFTVSNVGSLGIESFTPIVNPPQTGILGVCGITTRIREVDGEIRTYPAMGLSLTYDHRALDGSPASRFLRDLRVALENFTLLLGR